MNLINELKKIEGLNEKTKLKINCYNNVIIEGKYYGFTSAMDNEPEEAELDIISSENGGLIGVLESEIKTIEVIN